MLIVLGIVALFGVRYYVRQTKRRQAEKDVLKEPRGEAVATGMPIVCGNVGCSGKGRIPRQTLLVTDKTGSHCNVCSGTSYVLVSTMRANQMLAAAGVDVAQMPSIAAIFSPLTTKELINRS